MNSREIVKRTIEFDKPDRIPLMFPYLGFSDVCFISLKDSTSFKDKFERNLEREDEWGTIWRKPDPESGIVNMGYVKSVPIEDIDKLDSCKFPNPFDSFRYESIEEEIEKAVEKYKIICGATLFERAQQLCGMEKLLIGFYEKPDQINTLLNRINEFTMGILENMEKYKGKIDGFYMGDDWGTQSSSLISIEMFRKFFKPLYQKRIAKAHSLGMHVWLHSDGRINDIIEEFIDIGLDVINLQSPHVLGIEAISKRYRGKITFWCPVDLQKTLPFGSKEEIENEVNTLIHKWGTPEGGFIGSDYGSTEEDHLAIEVSKERVQWMLEAFKKYGGYNEHGI